MTVKVTNGQGGYEPGKLIRHVTRPLPRQQTQDFLGRVERVRFWEMPTEERKSSDVVCLDGAYWIIEGVKGGSYHVVERYCPDDGPVRELGLLAISFAGLKIPKGELY